MIETKLFFRILIIPKQIFNNILSIYDYSNFPIQLNVPVINIQKYSFLMKKQVMQSKCKLYLKLDIFCTYFLDK